jgi:signal transduction histidine kinase
VSRLLRGRPITVRITAGFLVAMALLLAATGAFVYERMSFALNRSIRDVPVAQRTEIDARKRHRDEALHELLVQLGVAFTGTLFVSGFVGYRVARAALDPVDRIRRRAGENSVDADFRLPVPETDDELARLAETLNGLLDRIQAGVIREHRFVADASHELRTPLSQMMLQADLLLARERSRDELRDAVLDMRKDTARLVKLANDLLLLARADEGMLALHREPMCVRDVLEDVLNGLAATIATHRITVAVDVDETLRVVGDRGGVVRAMANLVDNAIAHASSRVTVRARRGGGEVSLCVEDDGPGFPDGFVERAFDRFATGAPGRGGGGTGLGLAIVDAIATAEGGRVSAENVPEGGARVSLELPSV